MVDKIEDLLQYFNEDELLLIKSEENENTEKIVIQTTDINPTIVSTPISLETMDR